jgi:hypothetical protein
MVSHNMAATKRVGSGCLLYGEHGDSMRTHLALAFVFGHDIYLTHLNDKNNNNHPLATATTFSVLAIVIILVSTSIVTPAAASTTTTTTTAAEGNTNTTSSVLSSPIKLSPQPIYQESSPPGSVTPINQTHIIATHTGNGTLTLPNSNQTINTTGNATGVISFVTYSGIAKESIRAANGETATLTAYEIIKFNNPAAAPQGGAKNIVIAVLQTNSTGMLAPLNGTILAGIDELAPNGDTHLTLWRWESGIPLPAGNNTTATEQSSSSLMNTTTTNATADTPT